MVLQLSTQVYMTKANDSLNVKLVLWEFIKWKLLIYWSMFLDNMNMIFHQSFIFSEFSRFVSMDTKLSLYSFKNCCWWRRSMFPSNWRWQFNTHTKLEPFLHVLYFLSFYTLVLCFVFAVFFFLNKMTWFGEASNWNILAPKAGSSVKKNGKLVIVHINKYS